MPGQIRWSYRMRMQATVFIQPLVLLAAGMTFTLGAQTNSPPPTPPPAPLFNLPAPALRTTTATAAVTTTATTAAPKPAPPPAEKIKPAPAAPPPADPQPSVAFVSRSYGTWDFEHARSWHGRYEIEAPIHLPDDLFSRSVNAVFVPEFIHVGHTAVACSVWTAIKRRNPFCLINPIPLNVSW